MQLRLHCSQSKLHPGQGLNGLTVLRDKSLLRRAGAGRPFTGARAEILFTGPGAGILFKRLVLTDNALRLELGHHSLELGLVDGGFGWETVT